MFRKISASKFKSFSSITRTILVTKYHFQETIGVSGSKNQFRNCYSELFDEIKTKFFLEPTFWKWITFSKVSFWENFSYSRNNKQIKLVKLVLIFWKILEIRNFEIGCWILWARGVFKLLKVKFSLETNFWKLPSYYNLQFQHTNWRA